MTRTAAMWLEDAGAQRDVVAWAEGFADDWTALWQACPRGDWLLAIALRRGLDGARVVAAGRHVAGLALDHVEGAERAELEGLLARPSATDGARIEARAETSVDPAHQAALSAVAIALRGTPDEQAMIPALLVQAAAMDAADCGMSAAVSYVQRKSAELVREVIPEAP